MCGRLLKKKAEMLDLTVEKDILICENKYYKWNIDENKYKLYDGEYIDIIDSKDYIISNLEYQTQKTLNTMKKINFKRQQYGHT